MGDEFCEVQSVSFDLLIPVLSCDQLIVHWLATPADDIIYCTDAFCPGGYGYPGSARTRSTSRSVEASRT